jgi:Trk-type K+ transport system membrane component
LTLFLAITLLAGAALASRDGLAYLDAWFLCVSAITAGGLVPFDFSRLSQGSEVIIWLLFTCGGVLATSLPPLLWRVWLSRRRLRPLIAEAKALTRELAELRSAEAAAAVEAAAAAEKHAAHAAALAAAALEKARAAWAVTGSSAAEAARAATEEAEAEAELSSDDDAAADAKRRASPSPEPVVQRLRRTFSFLTHRSFTEDAHAHGPGYGHGHGHGDQALSPAAAAAATAAALTEAAASAASFSAADAADYEALSVEFQAQDEGLVALIATVLLYTGCWLLFGSLAFWSEYAAAGPHLPVLVARGISPAWLAIFLTSSALNNTGLSLMDDSLGSIATRPRALLVLAFAILAGNTAWPVALRVCLTAWARCCEALGAPARARGVRYALDNPQRCYHLLFDARGTAAVAVAVLTVTLFQLVFFLATSWDMVHADVAPNNELSRTETSAVIFFQVISTRSAGFQVVDIKRVADVMAVIMAFFFWFAPHPLVAALAEAAESERLTGVGEGTLHGRLLQPQREAAQLHTPPRPGGFGATDVKRGAFSPMGGRSLRLRPLAPAAAAAAAAAASMRGKVASSAAARAAEADTRELLGRHSLRGVLVRRYASRHASWIFFAFVTVSAAEQRLLSSPPLTPYARSPTTLFAILFELLSAYGTNGLSFGYPGVGYNLVGMFRPVSKLVVIGLLFLGRHRNMPRAVDRPLVAHVNSLHATVVALRDAVRATRHSLALMRVRARASEDARYSRGGGVLLAGGGDGGGAGAGGGDGGAAQQLEAALSEGGVDGGAHGGVDEHGLAAAASEHVTLAAALACVREHTAAKSMAAATAA